VVDLSLYNLVFLGLFLFTFLLLCIGCLSGSLDNGKRVENIDWWSDPDPKVHIGVGCDFCGVKALVHHIWHLFVFYSLLLSLLY